MKFDFKSLNIPVVKANVWVVAAVLGVVLALIAWLPWWWYFQRPVQFEGAAQTLDVVVPAGASGRTIAALAEEAGMQVSETTLLAALRVHGNAPAIHAGRYRFQAGMSLAEIVEKFSSGEVESFTMRIADGATVWQVRRYVEALADVAVTTRGLSNEELLEKLGFNVVSLEGLFAPETYRFRSGLSDLDVYRALYREQQRILNEAWKNRDVELVAVKTPYEALILASIIEKETARPEDRALVSSVFHNRLRRGMPLQTDPTIIYGIGEAFNGNLIRKDLRAPGPYNTYLNKGLPPTPISMPSAASIAAAMHPAETKYLYFVARGDGTTEFSTHLAAHNRAVYKYQKNPRRRAQHK